MTVTVTVVDMTVFALAAGTPPSTHYRYSWGDGQNGDLWTDSAGAGCLEHTFTDPGTYTISARDEQDNVVATTDVVVPGAPAPTPNDLTVGCEVWPIVWPCDTSTVAPEILGAAASLAEQLLWALSGYRIGVCAYREGFYPAQMGNCGYPYKDSNGNWRNGGGRSGMCCRVLLSHRPVEGVISVTDGGVELDADQYALEGSWLRRRDGACWAASFPCDDPTVIVVYQAGVPFPNGTGAVMGEVACEYLLALRGDSCKLPSRATSITRLGVTVTLDTAADFVERGRIGLPLTDAWLESVVGNGPRVSSRVFSPDLPRAVRV